MCASYVGTQAPLSLKSSHVALLLTKSEDEGILTHAGDVSHAAATEGMQGSYQRHEGTKYLPGNATSDASITVRAHPRLSALLRCIDSYELTIRVYRRDS